MLARLRKSGDEMRPLGRGALCAGLISLVAATVVLGTTVGIGSQDRAAAVVPPFSIATNPPMTPAFNSAIDDYAVRCTSSRTVLVTTTSSDTVSIAGTTLPGPASVSVPMVAGQGLTVTDGSSSYEIRCLPADFPSYTTSVTGTPQANGYFVGIGNYSAVFDADGVPVWWYRKDSFDTSVLPPLDSKFITPTTVAYWEPLASDLSPLNIQYGTWYLRGLDGSLLGTLGGSSFPLDPHDLQLLPNGNYLAIEDVTENCPAVPSQCVDLSSWGDSAQSAVIDPIIVELTPSDQIVWQWDTLAHIPDVAQENVNWHANLPDVFHTNSLEYDGNGGIIVSERFLDAVYRIDMATGDITWKLGGTTTPQSLSVVGDPYVAAGGALFSGQHDARLDPDGSLTVHDNGTYADRPVRGVRFTIDTSTMTATEVEQVSDARDPNPSPQMGSVQKLTGGDWVVDWGFGDYVSDLNSQGVPQLTIIYPGLFSYRSEPVTASVAAMQQGMDAMVPPVAPPVTSMLIPGNGATVTGTQLLDAGASAGTSQVQYELTGGTLNQAVVATGTPTLYGWLTYWDSTTVPNGTYTLQSVARYAGGITGTSPGISITVNNASPATSVVLPASGATVSGTKAIFDAVASPGTTQVQYELTGGTLNQAVVATGTPTLYGWLTYWDSTTVPNGTYTLQSVARYAGGITGTSPGISITVSN
jgi:hypothetical protein